MKNILLLTAILFSLAMKGQQTKIFTSDYQVSEEAVRTFTIPYKITVVDPKEKNVREGLIKLWDIKYNYQFSNNKITYLKTEKDEDGTTVWYTLYNNPKFNIFKIQYYSTPIKKGDKSYKTLLIFSLYDENNIRVSDLGMLANPTKNPTEAGSLKSKS